jgi:hypothetical protein
MKNLLKHLALLAFGSLSLAGGSVFAETLTVTGTVIPNTCVLKFYNSSTAAAAASVSTIALPTISVNDLGAAAAGLAPTNNNGTPVFIKALTSAGAACTTGVTTGSVGTFNVLITGTRDVTLATKVGNATTAANGGATGVTIDLVPATGTVAGLDITATTFAANHGQTNVATNAALQFTAKYYKTGAAITSGSLSVPFTVTASWL